MDGKRESGKALSARVVVSDSDVREGGWIAVDLAAYQGFASAAASFARPQATQEPPWRSAGAADEKALIKARLDGGLQHAGRVFDSDIDLAERWPDGSDAAGEIIRDRPRDEYRRGKQSHSTRTRNHERLNGRAARFGPFLIEADQQKGGKAG